MTQTDANTAAAEGLAALLAETLSPVTDRDDNRHYPYPPTGQDLISVTTVIGGTQSKPWLANWGSKLAAQYAADNLAGLLTLLKPDGSGREAVVDAIKGESRRRRDAKRDAGIHVHDLVEALLLWAASPEGTGGDIALPTLPPRLENVNMADDDEPVLPLRDFVEAVTDGFLNFMTDFDVRAELSEAQVYNAELGVAGTIDLVGYLRRHRLRLGIDVKTGKNLDAEMREQLAAYRRMTEVLVDKMGLLAPMPATDAGAVLHLRPHYERGYRLMVVSPEDDAEAWNTFRHALRTYLDREGVRAKPGRVLYPIGPDGQAWPARLADLDGEGYGAGISALIKAGHTTVAEVADLTHEACLDVKGIGAKTIEGVARALKDRGLGFAKADAEAVA